MMSFMIPSPRRTSSAFKKMHGKRVNYGLRASWKYALVLALVLVLLLLAIGIIGWKWNVVSVQDEWRFKPQLPAKRLSNEISAQSLSKDIPRISKPEFLYLVGVEGAAHHGVFDILARLGADRCREHHYSGLEGKSRNLWLRNSSKCAQEHQAQKQTCPLFLRGEIAHDIFGKDGVRRSPHVNNPSAVIKKAHLLQEVGPLNLSFLTIQDRSFPTGWDISIRKRPWPISLTNLFHTFSSDMWVRFIVLLRPFVKCVSSHIDFDAGPVAHALKLSEYLEYFGEVLDFIPRHQWRVLPVECLYRSQVTRERILLRLIEYLDWRPDGRIECCGCLDGWRDSKHHDVAEEVLEQIMLVERINEHKWGVLRKSGYLENSDQYLSHPELCA